MASYPLYLSTASIIALIGAATLSSALRQTSTPRAGAGDLLVAPTRIVLGGPKRTAEINLLNIGTKPALYRISLVHERMDENGRLVDVETSGPNDKFADDLVRFTPHQVLLAPQISQVIRIQMRLPANLDAGEYRSHMLFRAVTAPAADDKAPIAGTPPKGISVQITPVYGVSIPVIVRSGQTSASTDFSDVHVVTAPGGEPALVGKLTRSGSASVYGDLLVEFAEHGKPFRPLARANGLAVYTPNLIRNFALILSKDKSMQFRNGTLRVTYRVPETDGGQTIAKTEIVLQ